jgi:hypothetical protein
MQQETLLTVEEIAHILKINRNTIQSKRWQQQTGCPLIKLGKRLYVVAAEFWKWFHTHRMIEE